MPAAAGHAVMALNALLEELEILREQEGRIAMLEIEVSPDVAEARAEALTRLTDADRLDLFEASTQALATACARREIPQPARAAAYSALMGLIASDLLPQPTFRTLYESWEEALDGLGNSSSILRGEEVLFRIE